MKGRRQTVEHPFGTLKFWMGSTHFQTKTLPRVWKHEPLDPENSKTGYEIEHMKGSASVK